MGIPRVFVVLYVDIGIWFGPSRLLPAADINKFLFANEL
jgi:hypothetical protein